MSCHNFYSTACVWFDRCFAFPYPYFSSNHVYRTGAHCERPSAAFSTTWTALCSRPRRRTGRPPRTLMPASHHSCCSAHWPQQLLPAAAAAETEAESESGTGTAREPKLDLELELALECCATRACRVRRRPTRRRGGWRASSTSRVRPPRPPFPRRRRRPQRQPTSSSNRRSRPPNTIARAPPALSSRPTSFRCAAAS